MNRPKSSKDLKSMKLTTADYHEREAKSPGGKTGKYGITVPKPFSFDIRDKVKAKSIRERKVEKMIKQKENQENETMNFQFRHKPVPPEVLIPRYKAIQEADE
jgi:hypothetical protein